MVTSLVVNSVGLHLTEALMRRLDTPTPIYTHTVSTEDDRFIVTVAKQGLTVLDMTITALDLPPTQIHTIPEHGLMTLLDNWYDAQPTSLTYLPRVIFFLSYLGEKGFEFRVSYTSHTVFKLNARNESFEIDISLYRGVAL